MIVEVNEVGILKKENCCFGNSISFVDFIFTSLCGSIEEFRTFLVKKTEKEIWSVK